MSTDAELLAASLEIREHYRVLIYIYIYIYIFILTAIELSPGGSTHLHTNNT
jgi:hypothetical protein